MSMTEQEKYEAELLLELLLREDTGAIDCCKQAMETDGREHSPMCPEMAQDAPKEN